MSLQEAIKDKYGKAALGAGSSCCGGSCGDPITSNLYSANETDALPREAVQASLGCGNPTAMIDLEAAGALEESDYRDKLNAAGFESVEIEPWRVYDVKDARAFLADVGVDADAIAPIAADKFASAFIRARKPELKACCGPTCCASQR